jgi:hypothetical protein
MNNNKPHLSPSQLDMFSRCPEAYRRRYMEGEKIPPGVAMLIGSGFHGGAAVNMRQKKDSFADLPLADMQEATAAEFEAATKGGYVLNPEEAGQGAANVLGAAKDQAVKLIGVYATRQAPEYQPVIIEERVRIELPLVRDFVGVIDLADDQDRIVDFKTASRSKQQAEADSSQQLTGYAALFQALKGKKPSSLRLDVVLKTKTPGRQVLNTTRDDSDFRVLGARLEAMSRSIDAGCFPPASPGAWWCSAKFCGYHSSCPYVHHGKTVVDLGDDAGYVPFNQERETE